MSTRRVGLVALAIAVVCFRLAAKSETPSAEARFATLEDIYGDAGGSLPS